MRFVRVDGILAQWPDWNWLPHTSVGEVAGKTVGAWLTAKGQALVTLLNTNSVEIITFGIVICGLGMMIAPFMGSHPSKWLGRTFGILWLGVIWRVLI